MRSNSSGFDKPRLRRDAEREVDALVDRLVAEPAGRGLRVLLAHGGCDVGRREAELREPVRLQPDTDRVIARAEHLHVADARNAAQLVDHVQASRSSRRTARRSGRPASRTTGSSGSSAATFATVTPCRRTSSGSSCSALCTRFCTLMIAMSGSVPTANVSAISSVPRGRAARAHVQHVLDAVQRLLERRGDGLRDHVGARARVDRRDADLRRRDVRVHRDRQLPERGEPGDHDECRNDRREQRPVDEEVRDHCAVVPGSLLRAVPVGDRHCVDGRARLHLEDARRRRRGAGRETGRHGDVVTGQRAELDGRRRGVDRCRRRSRRTRPARRA